MPKTLAEINAALDTRYAGPLKELQGRSYIPWDQAVKFANTILGPDSYDVEIQSYKLEQILNGKTGETTYGYSAVVRLTVRPSDAFPIIRDGLGFNEMEFSKEKNYIDRATGEEVVVPARAMIDPSIKGAASGALLRALVLLGDAFGLFLYNDKGGVGAQPSPTNGVRQERPTAASTTTQTSTHANGSAKPALSEKQENVLRNKGFSADLINQIHLLSDWKERKQLMDSVFAGASVNEVVAHFGLRNTVGVGSGYPSELDGEEEEAAF